MFDVFFYVLCFLHNTTNFYYPCDDYHDFDNVITVAGTEDFTIHLAQLKYFGVDSKIYFLPKYLRGF